MQSKLLLLIQPDPQNRLENVLSEHVVFHSPVRDYGGRADVAHLLMTIGSVLDEIEAQDELVAGRQVVTIITAARGDHRMTGALDETYDALGRVERATLLLRPMSALLDAISGMRAALERAPLPSSLPPEPCEPPVALDHVPG
jgi:hypothetical protein